MGSIKTIKGYLLRPAVCGEVGEARKMTGKEFFGLLDFIKALPVSQRHFGKDSPLLAIFSEDKTGDESLYVPSDKEGIRHGLFLKQRDSMLPYAGHDTDDGIDAKRIDIGTQSYMFENTYFVADSATGLILFVNRREVSNINGFASYLSSFLSPSPGDNTFFALDVGKKQAHHIELEPVMESDIYQHLERMCRKSKLTIRFGVEKGGNASIGYASSDEGIAELLSSNSIRGCNVSVTITPEKGKSLEGQGIRKIVRKLIDMAGRSKEKCGCLVEGKDMNGLPDKVDFFEDRVFRIAKIACEGKYLATNEVFPVLDRMLKEESAKDMS